MDVREKLDEALKDISIADEEMLDAFFAFANEHLAHAIEAVNETNQLLQEIKKELTHESRGATAQIRRSYHHVNKVT